MASGLATLGAGCARTPRAGDTLRVGSTATGAPFSFLDVKSNTLVGAMVDIARAVGAEAGLGVQIDTTAFSALVPSLMSRRIDVIAAGLLRTPEREQVVAFSRPVYAYGGAVALRAADRRLVPALPALRPANVGVQVGTRFLDQLTAAGVERIRTYDSLADMLRDLETGRIDAGYGDAPVLKWRLAQAASTAPMRLSREFTAPTQEEVCLVVRRDADALLARLNAAISRLGATQIPAILARWGLA